MIINLIFIALSVLISIIGIIIILLHKENFGSNLKILLLISNFIIIGIIYFISYNLYGFTIYNEISAILFFKISISIGLLSLTLIISTQSLILEKKKTNFIPLLLYSFFGSLIIGELLFTPNLIAIFQINGEYIIILEDLSLVFHFSIFIIIILIHGTINLLKNYSKIRDNALDKLLVLMFIELSSGIITFYLSVIIPNPIFRNLHLFLYLISLIVIFYAIMFKSFLFVALTNQIHDFIIFHKSGILLYNYNFETDQEVDDTVLKGSILIGINHILVNFSDKRNQLNLIKMKNRTILFEIDNTYGFAILLIVRRKNFHVDLALRKFIARFIDLNKENLTKLNDFSQLIDISVYRNTKALLKEVFEAYVSKSL